MAPGTLIWLILGAMAAIDGVLLKRLGLTISVRWYVFAVVILLIVLSRMYRRRSPPVALLARAAAQIVGFSHIGGVLTYAAMAATPFPMADGRLSHADAAIGFDWVAWFHWVQARQWLHVMFTLAYGSIPFQVIVLSIYFAFKDRIRVEEFLLAGILALLLTVALMVPLPAVGAWSEHGTGMTEPWRPDILALRAHSLVTIGETKGIVSFPSYHTALAVLLVHMARNRKWFPIVLEIDLLLIASVMTQGAHFGVDMLGGAGVAIVSIAAAKALLKVCQPRLSGMRWA